MAKGSYAPKPAEQHAANLSVLKERLKTGSLSGAYVFYGDEEYTKNYYYNEMLKACGDRKLNVRTFYGDDFQLSDFINACDTVSTQAIGLFDQPEDGKTQETGYRMVKLVAPAFDELGKSDEKHFLSRIDDPDEGVMIVFWLYAGEDEKLTKGIYKKIAEAALTVNFRRETNGSNVLISWILRHFTRAGIAAERQVVSYFNNYVGNDMTTLKNEIEKCVDYLRYEGRDTLTVQDVNFICKKSVSAQIFDISSAALAGDYAASMAAYNVFRDSGEKALPVFGTLSKAVYDLCTVERLSRGGAGAAEIARKVGLRDFVVRNYQNLLRKREGDGGNISYARYAAEVCLLYDGLLKSSRTDGYELLEELIFKLSCAKRK